jgi:hypothetical protein
MNILQRSKIRVLIWHRRIQKICIDWNCYQEYKDIVISFKRARQNGEKQGFSLNRMLKYIWLMGMEACKTLPTAVQILLTLPYFSSNMWAFFFFSRNWNQTNHIRNLLHMTRHKNTAIPSTRNEVASSINVKFSFKFLTNVTCDLSLNKRYFYKWLIQNLLGAALVITCPGCQKS